MTTLTIHDYHLARNHAGFSYNPATETADQGRVRSALATARDLYAYRNDPSAYVSWEVSMFEWDGDFPYDGPLYDATLYVDDKPATSLCSIAVESTNDPYCRVIEAELYGEHTYNLERRREAAIVRGEN